MDTIITIITNTNITTITSIFTRILRLFRITMDTMNTCINCNRLIHSEVAGQRLREVPQVVGQRLREVPQRGWRTRTPRPTKEARLRPACTVHLLMAPALVPPGRLGGAQCPAAGGRTVQGYPVQPQRSRPPPLTRPPPGPGNTNCPPGVRACPALFC